MNHKARWFKSLSLLLTVCILLTGIPMVTAASVDELSNTALSLYEETYKSLTGRITDRGYTETSLTGAYSGMYLRDSAIQIMAQNAYGDYHLSREMLQFILGQHQDLGWEYTQHILGYFSETNSNYDNTYLTASADTAEAYLGCADVGTEQWNIQSDYVYGAFTANTDTIKTVRAYTRLMVGTGTLTAAVCTDVYGKGEQLGTATLSFSVEKDAKGWQTLTFDTPVTVIPGQTYYLRLGSDNAKVTLWGAPTDSADEHRAYVDAGRSGGGWRTNYLPNFLINADDGMDIYLGCADKGTEQWNILTDYVYGAFVPDTNKIGYVKAYVKAFAGVGTLTAAICTDVYGKGEELASATISFDSATNTEGWQTLTFDTPVAVTAGQTYYLRLGSDDVKMTLWGAPTDGADEHRAYVDAGRSGGGWRTNYLPNFVIPGDAVAVDNAYLGNVDVGTEQWNILFDYLYGAFVPDGDTISTVKAYVKAFAGTGTLTAAICTDVYGRGEELGTATLSLDCAVDAAGWQTLTFDTPVTVIPGQTYYLRLGSDDIKVTLWGAPTNGDDKYRAYVDAGRSGGGWRTDYLPNFEIPGSATGQGDVILTLDGDTAGVQVVPVLESEKISALRVILSRDKDADGVLKATLFKGHGADATLVDRFEMDVAKLSDTGEWVKLSFSLPIVEVDAQQDYSLKLELVDATGKVYWHGTDKMDQYGTYTLEAGQYRLVPGEASFEAYKSGGASIWSKEIQPDGNYMFIHAWHQYATGCLDNEDNRTFIAQSYPVIRTYANYFLDNGYIGDNGLMRNPYFEHSREGRKWNSYDLITNVFASQALYEMSDFAAEYGDTASATKWSVASAALTEAIEKHLVVEYDGVDIYAELYNLDNGEFIPGISWVNLAPMAAEWYAMATEIMQNTLDLYGVYATDTFYGFKMLHSTGLLGKVEGGTSVIGKGLSWEIMYYDVIGNEARRDYLLNFIETVAASCGVYAEGYRKDRLPDPANQEHASWQFYAVTFVYPELTKSYAMEQLAAVVDEVALVDIDRLREESLGEPLDNVYALRDKANQLLANERTTKKQYDQATQDLRDALDYLSYIDEAPRARLFHTGGQTSKMEMTDSTLGLAFSFTLEMNGGVITDKNLFDSTNATVDVAKNNIHYQLVRMGAVVTNRRAVGEDADNLTLDSINGATVKDVPAVYAYEATETAVSYSVRITNIPLHHDQTPIYARPYYVYLFNGEEVVVYGDVYSQSYTPQDSNDVTVDW